MATPAQYSETNLLNSLAVYLAEQLVTDGYLVYWHKRDALQTGLTSADWWYQYSTNLTTYQANGTYTAKVAAARGILTIVDGIPAEPRFVTRLISDSSVGPQDEVPVPALSVEIGPEVTQDPYELGSKIKWRTRHLVIDGYLRDVAEWRRLKDRFPLWFERDSQLAVADYDSGSTTPTVVGSVDVQQVRVDATQFVDRAQAMTYQVMVNAFLVYVA